MTRPKVKDVNWIRIFHNAVGEAYRAEGFPDYFKVKINRYNKHAFFYGEDAQLNYQRYIIEETNKYNQYGMP